MTDDLNAQIAQRLFGWRYNKGIWWQPYKDESGNYSGAGLAPPAYTTDPAATAQVWQRVEHITRQIQNLRDLQDAFWIEFLHEDHQVTCYLYLDSKGTGKTWQEALCQAALILQEKEY